MESCTYLITSEDFVLANTLIIYCEAFDELSKAFIKTKGRPESKGVSSADMQTIKELTPYSFELSVSSYDDIFKYATGQESSHVFEEKQEHSLIEKLKG